MNELDVFGARTGHGRDRLYGVEIGVVVDNKDPQGYGRVKVRFPRLSGDEISYWARISALMAGAERGTFFLPEVDDEVLVAFERGEITRPYVLGALWNGRDRPPDTNANGENNLRFIKSRSGHVIRLDDTEGAEKIEIIDKSGDYQITIDTANQAIAIQSNKDITLNAPHGKIQLNAQTIELSSSAETKIMAQGGMMLDGTPGNTDVKGTLINLN